MHTITPKPPLQRHMFILLRLFLLKYKVQVGRISQLNRLIEDVLPAPAIEEYTRTWMRVIEGAVSVMMREKKYDDSREKRKNGSQELKPDPASGDINGKVGERHRSRHGRGSKKTAGYEDSWRDKMYGAKICYSRGNEQRRG
ncbi:2934_t:CDS:2, partial [Acaulospora colombiana]